MIFDQMIQRWKALQKHQVLRLAGAGTAGLGALLVIMFPTAPPSPSDLSGLFILVALVSLAAWWSLGQAWRLRKVVFFFRSSRGGPQAES